MSSTLKPDAAPFIPSQSLRGGASTFLPPTPGSMPSPPMYYAAPLFEPVPSCHYCARAPLQVPPEPYRYDHAAHVNYMNHGSSVYQGLMDPLQDASRHYPSTSEGYEFGGGYYKTKPWNRRKYNNPAAYASSPTAYPSTADSVWYDNRDAGYVGGEGAYGEPKPRKAKKGWNKNWHRNRGGVGKSSVDGAFLSEFVGGEVGKEEQRNEKESDKKTIHSIDTPITASDDKENTNAAHHINVNTNTKKHKTAHSTRSHNIQPAHQPADEDRRTPAQCEPRHDPVKAPAHAKKRSKTVQKQISGGEKENAGHEGVAREDEYFEKKVWGSQREMKAMKGKKEVEKRVEE
ncbi:hypothetical protein P153DRAFT_396764 [Dothidotthia symphoricarpi CBS 119687]|uniref:Uncharacterized protein n=1 Tax=Dothidotthia symphoricarpi CBS 119687 TaxID=1392245 RepID=A0A6A6AEY3_9PLEO|nr:uncharacterized protein P153DRAFT_396764 [Dothidotthia symphoricarpi CBS 119687]KAF2129504.1 hypothetical protein P153DRAFT_396764 [Dothidotthia symphoricarpi CBS 119687]